MNSFVEKNRWGKCNFFNVTKKGSITDFSSLLDAPAGKYGRTIAKGEKFVFEKNGVPMRFNGTNLCFSANYPDRKTADAIADEFARTGFNILRIHHHDDLLAAADGKDSSKLNMENLDKLEYLFAACKKRGIYITTDLYVSRKVKEGEFPHLPYPLNIYQYKRLTLVDKKIFANLAKFTERWLTHRNPYTGLTWAEDPALVSISCVNEDIVWPAEDDFIRKIYLDAFVKYAKKKGGVNIKGDIRHHFFPVFLHDFYLSFKKRITNVVRKCGYSGLVTDLNWVSTLWCSLLRRDFDYADNHLYWNHPSFPVNPWKMPGLVKQDSILNSKPFGFGYIAPARIFGKPYAVTEWNFTSPSESAIDGALIAGAYYSLQDYSMLCRFAWAHHIGTVDSEKRTVNFFDSASDPLRRLSERVAGAFFLRGDVAPSEVSYPYIFDDKCPGAIQFAYKEDSKRTSKLCDLALVGKVGICYADEKLPPDTGFVIRNPEDPLPASAKGFKAFSINSAKTHIPKQLPYNIIKNPSTELFISSTGELALERKKGIFMAVTPGSEAFILSKKGLSAEGRFASAKTLNGYASFCAIAKDGKALSDSKRILLLHLTSCINSDFRFAKKNGLFENWGRAPVLMRKNTMEVTLKIKGELSLYACAFDGSRIGGVEIDRISPDGWPVFKFRNFIGGTPVAVYEIVRKKV